MICENCGSRHLVMSTQYFPLTAPLDLCVTCRGAVQLILHAMDQSAALSRELEKT